SGGATSRGVAACRVVLCARACDGLAMRWIGFAWLAALACGTPAASRAPRSAPGVMRYSFITVGRHAGDAELKIGADGSRVGHFTFNDRGRGPDVRATLVLDDAGAPRSLRAAGHDYLKAQVDEKLDESGGTLAWQSTGEHGQAPTGSGWYIPQQD